MTSSDDPRICAALSNGTDISTRVRVGRAESDCRHSGASQDGDCPSPDIPTHSSQHVPSFYPHRPQMKRFRLTSHIVRPCRPRRAMLSTWIDVQEVLSDELRRREPSVKMTEISR